MHALLHDFDLYLIPMLHISVHVVHGYAIPPRGNAGQVQTCSGSEVGKEATLFQNRGEKEGIANY